MEPISIVLVGGSFRLLSLVVFRWFSALSCCVDCGVNFTQKSEPVLARPSSASYPESCTSLCADLVEALSLVICEEITWRPFLFWLSDSWSSKQDRVLVDAVFTSNLN